MFSNATILSLYAQARRDDDLRHLSKVKPPRTQLSFRRALRAVLSAPPAVRRPMPQPR